jgi:hypothetical protein
LQPPLRVCMEKQMMSSCVFMEHFVARKLLHIPMRVRRSGELRADKRLMIVNNLLYIDYRANSIRCFECWALALISDHLERQVGKIHSASRKQICVRIQTLILTQLHYSLCHLLNYFQLLFNKVDCIVFFFLHSSKKAANSGRNLTVYSIVT